MKVFVASSYSSQVNSETGEVYASYKDWLEDILNTLESYGHSVFCALRADGYAINDSDPASAFSLDVTQIEAADAIFAIVSGSVSAGVQTEIGYALAMNKKVIIAHKPQDNVAWFNMAIVAANHATTVTLPLTKDPLTD